MKDNKKENNNTGISIRAGDLDSKIRFNVISGEWVIVAPIRAKRKKNLFAKKIKRDFGDKSSCPFEDLRKSGNKPPYFWYPKDVSLDKYEVQILENKYPALTHDKTISCSSTSSKTKVNRIYSTINGTGYHDLVVTKWHNKNFPDLSDSVAFYVFEAFIKRYKQIAKSKCSKYVSIFQDYGTASGASVLHPHYQIISIPMVPSHISRSLEFSKKYYSRYKKCVYCDIIKNEKRINKRIICSNNYAIAFVPFDAREPFQINIFPLKHFSYFEDTPAKVIKGVISVLKEVLLKMRSNIQDPDYNFFIYTSPIYRKNDNKHYHWRIEVVPRNSDINAGFELSTGIKINPITPEDATLEILGKLKNNNNNNI